MLACCHFALFGLLRFFSISVSTFSTESSCVVIADFPSVQRCKIHFVSALVSPRGPVRKAHCGMHAGSSVHSELFIMASRVRPISECVLALSPGCRKRRARQCTWTRRTWTARSRSANNRCPCARAAVAAHRCHFRSLSSHRR